MINQQQSEEQRLKLKNELEKKRIEAYEKEKKAVAAAVIPAAEKLVQQRPPSADQQKNNLIKLEPSPVNMTEVFSAIGVVGKKMYFPKIYIIKINQILTKLINSLIYIPKTDQKRKFYAI